MSEHDFRKLLSSAIGWPFTLNIKRGDECEEYESSREIRLVKLTLWDLTITDAFRVDSGRWYSEGGDGIIVDTPLTVWQWIAIRFCDMAKEGER